MGKVENKTFFLNYPNNKVNVLLEAMRDLQKYVDEFDKVVTDYRKNLDLTEHLQELIEEVSSSCCNVICVVFKNKSAALKQCCIGYYCH